METPSESIFDPEVFRSDLTEKTETYADKKSEIRARFTPEENEQTQKSADALYSELLDDCAEALLLTDDKPAVMEIIRRTLVNYTYGSGYDLFGGHAKTQFYSDLATRIAQKAAR